MNFYAIRAVLEDGTWSHPWTIFATSYSHAIDRFQIETGMDDVSEVIIRKRPMQEAATFYGRNDTGGGAVEHPTVMWSD